MDNTTNTTSIDLSQNLSKQDIIKVNLAHAYYIYGGNPKRAIALLKPYIDDKKNIKARYIYASALSRYDLNTSLTMLKDLTDEGYPYAMETYGEKRTCELNKYNKSCQKQGYDKLLKTTYITWHKSDPKELYNDAYQQYLDIPEDKRVNKQHTWYSNKADKLLCQCAKEHFFQCANALQLGYYSIKNRTEKQEHEYKYYKDIAKKILIDVENNNLYATNYIGCFDKKRKSVNEICLTHDEYKKMLDNLAIKGNLREYSNLSYLLFNSNDEYSLTDYVTFYAYLLYPDVEIPNELKTSYDKAIKLNNGLGWDFKMISANIKPWEKLYNDKNLNGFFNKVNQLSSEE
ncbi:hypothetical protein C0W35_21020 [Photobacterium kishitanii]|nr:hypothetical protein C0W35_21020 [Photobacterium kishitanii]